MPTPARVHLGYDDSSPSTKVPVTSLRDASTKAVAYRDEYNLGASEGPLDHNCVTRGPKLLAVVSYNGEVVLYGEGATVRGYVNDPTALILRRATDADLDAVL